MTDTKVKEATKKAEAKKETKPKKAAKKTIRVKLVGSLIGERDYAYGTVKGLGLRRLNSERELEDTPAIRGMVNKIPHLVKIISE